MLLQAVTQVQAMPFVPKLTLSGKWMEEAGFLTSTFINVEVQFGRLVITSE